MPGQAQGRRAHTVIEWLLVAIIVGLLFLVLAYEFIAGRINKDRRP